jgi:four helix bundle protein
MGAKDRQGAGPSRKENDMHVVNTASNQESQAAFGYERLDAYRVALRFAELAHPLARRLPRTKGQLGDQLERAAESIVLRIAEGAGCELRSADQRRHFRAGRASAMECGAILDICRIRGVGAPELLAEGRHLLLRLVQMLSRLCRGG